MSSTNQTIAETLGSSISKIASDVGALAGRVTRLERSLGYLMKMNMIRSDRDNDGVYRKVSYYRPDGTLFQTSQLEHDPLIPVVNGVYNKRVTTIYNKQGDAIVDSWSASISYDADGVLISEQIL
jgi:hypothetical protein